MNIIIVDDEKMAIDVLSIILKRLTQFKVSIKGAFTNAVDALHFLEKESVDVIFLDIEMIDIQGIQVAKQLVKRHPFIQVIFVTAHSQFAVDAFDVEATDYLLKPVHENRLIKALTKVQKRLKLQMEENKEHEKNLLYAHTLGSFYLHNNQHEVMKWRTRKVRELFLYLWFHQKQPIANAVIIEELWPDLDFEKASSNLHTTIYQLRKLLKDNGLKEPIQLVNNHYQLNVEIKSDLDELNALLEQENHDDVSIQKLLNCYESDFLAEEEYSWAIHIRSYLKQEVLNVLEKYTANSTSTNSLLKYNCLQKMLELDEFNEQYMYQLLEFLIKQNKKQQCIEYYNHIKSKLIEIDLPIPEEIERIYNDYMKEA
ncbi:response regulator [Bacillus sp. Gen3]|nr:response regulator [Bacillus sp. Gen3]